MAALHPSVPIGKRVSLTVQNEGQSFIVCTLEAGRVDHQPIQLTYAVGQIVALSSIGDHDIYLTGCHPIKDDDDDDVPDFDDEEIEDDDEEDSDDEDEDEDEDDGEDEEGDEDEEDFDDDDGADFLFGDDDDDDDDDDDEDDDDDDDYIDGSSRITELDEDDDDEEEEPKAGVKRIRVEPAHPTKVAKTQANSTPAAALQQGKKVVEDKTGKKAKVDVKQPEQQQKEAKKAKVDVKQLEQQQKEQTKQVEQQQQKKQQQKQQQEEVAKLKQQQEQAAKFKQQQEQAAKAKAQEQAAKLKAQEDKKKALEQQQQQQQQQKPKVFQLSGGVVAEDLKVGSGRVASKGNTAQVYYRGTLENKKQFDAKLSGQPFSFKIGAGSVIKGWDVGVAGMAVGGKRRLLLPPHMAYGSQGAPPDIPRNAKLIFEVELVGLK